MTSNRHVLVLDDNDGNRLLLEVALKMQGFTCEGVGSGTEALAKAQPGVYGLILLDVNLPDMNGLEVARRIRQTDSEVILIAATIDDDDQTLKRAEAAGCNVFLIKPFDLDQLKQFFTQVQPEQLRRSGKLLVLDNTALSRFER